MINNRNEEILLNILVRHTRNYKIKFSDLWAEFDRKSMHSFSGKTEEIRRRSFQRLLKSMCENSPNEDVTIRHEKPYYWVELSENYHNDPDIDFTQEEILQIIDAIIMSKNISAEDTKTLIEKIKILSNDPNYLPLRNTPDYASIKSLVPHNTQQNFYNLPIIQEAIAENKKIIFFRNRYNTSKALCPVTKEMTKASPYYILPIDGYYYLLCNIEGTDGLERCRIDLLTEVEETSEKSKSKKDASVPDSIDLGKYISEQNTFNFGNIERVRMLVHKGYMTELIDSFGINFEIDENVDESLDRNHDEMILVTLNSTASRICSWALQHPPVKILEPKSFKHKYSSALHFRIEQNKFVEQLFSDAVKRAEKTGHLHLVKLNFDGPRPGMVKRRLTVLKDITHATFIDNGRSYFDFLKNYPQLESLTIGCNEIENDSLFSQLPKLKRLKLFGTHIKDISFLTELDTLETLYLDEEQIEDIEPIYHVKSLQKLVVNQKINSLLCGEKLKAIYGSEFQYGIIDDQTEEIK